MNTQAHAVINLALLGRAGSPVRSAAILIGSVLPDLQIVGFWIVEKLRGTPEQVIWDTRYFEVHEAFDWLNAIPLALLGWGVATRLNKPVAEGFFAGLTLHCVVDLLVHNNDAHRHFLPLTNWRFISPVSYWDPAHYGIPFLVFEFLLVAACCRTLSHRHPSASIRAMLAGVLGLYLLVGVAVAWWVLATG